MSASAPSETSSAVDSSESIPETVSTDDPRERGNFAKLVVFQVLLRIGWIFKTESVVMPAVLDSVGAAAWLRALLPALNRFGQSVAPLLYAERLARNPIKRRPLAVWTLVMGLPFLVLAVTWNILDRTAQAASFATIFLAAYGCFFVATGINQLGYVTLQGKLIPVHRRGRLLSLANLLGVLGAVFAAGLLMPRWFTQDNPRFDRLFLFTGVCFLLCGIIAWRLDESPDSAKTPGKPEWQAGIQVWRLLRHDPRLMRLAIVAWACGSSLILFPHYQPLARQWLGLGFDQLVIWVIVQNLGTALFSAPGGWIADRSGNRKVIIWAAGLMLLGPSTAWGWGRFGQAYPQAFTLVFLFLGLTPVTFKILGNYVLELVEPAEHPVVLGMLAFAFGAPTIVLSPLAGIAIDHFGYDPVFALVLVTMALGWWASLGLVEPRIQA